MGKSIWAVVAGILVNVILATVTDSVFEMVAVTAYPVTWLGGRAYAKGVTA